MASTFHGLETARRGLFAQQNALQTTGHNIANANSPGYSRQRVDFTTSSPLRTTNGLIGTGVEPGVVQRIRDNYMDTQFRMENSKLGYYDSISSALSKMEDIMNEPSDNGLQAVMDKFWNSLQDLANNPQNSATRQVVASNGQMVADTFNYYSNSLERIKSDLGNEMNVTVSSINSIVSRIDELNKQIATVEPHGHIPNDLYDKRDLLVDELSGLVNIKVNPVKPTNHYGQPATAAVGLYEIKIVQEDGSPYENDIKLISVDQDSAQTNVNQLVVNIDNNKKTVTEIKVGENNINNLDFIGKLGGLIKNYGHQLNSGDTVEGYYPEMLENLNQLASEFATKFNEIHTQGFILDEDTNGGNFFEGIDGDSPAQNITVSAAILADPTKIAAGLHSGNSGDNGNVFKLVEVITSYDSEYASIIGELGVNAQSANRNLENVQILADSVNNNRLSVSGVSLDEEMTNLITYQHAYNASARMITVVDEMLDKIINGMGLGGR